ncbi:SGNH/GDSL hydrolase family protein [Streptomyces huiliensis]|uniref:SGNH/GDSL hydrolase family protein n=1 Tax=Streptomyces huiliensis TaxID=2876027 RepID=UPI001CBDE4D4|nr:SGNH/GDSL hydrolase family protein [Streptomyces huiliensis]MBZ4324009.1 SGNH/GDSL hydrolase family protein [Streptomyces huiliensis]
MRPTFRASPFRASPFRASRLAAVLAAASALLWSAPPPAVAAGPAGSYAVLGDSYSSGVGAGPYDPLSGLCLRSPRAHGPLWAAAHGVRDFRFPACAGATSEDVLRKQVGVLDPGTRLVTLTLGGNDVGYSGVMLACTVGLPGTCDAATDRAEAEMDRSLPRRLDAAYHAIAQRAPRARVVVLGYPYLFGGPSCLVPSPPNARRMDRALDHLDAVIADRARAARFTYLDARRAFAGHGACTGAPWIHPAQPAFWEAFHPNAAGQRGYFGILARHL